MAKVEFLLKNFQFPNQKKFNLYLGKWNGGDGVQREYIFKEKLQVSILSERRVYAPNGLYGGMNGERGMNLFTYPDGR